MNETGNLWAIGYDDVARAEQARAEILKLLDEHFLTVADVAIVVRKPDGSFQVDRAPDPSLAGVAACTLVGFLAGLVVLQPLAGAAVGGLLGGVGVAMTSGIGIDEWFVSEVRGLIKPGTSALFFWGFARDLDVLLHCIRGPGGTVLQTTVDLERAKAIQAALDTDQQAS
jgi:uncharacterized membrane protein